jgi:lipopolysaccharide/colanic/teichoic acid biosynthesis glycosyltransferase
VKPDATNRELNPFGVCRRCKAHGIHAPDVFQTIVDRERHRSDRNRHVFSVAIFETGHAPGCEAAARDIAEVLGEVVRCTDEVGWIDEGGVGVLLPETQPRGAWRFAEKTVEAMQKRGLSASFEIYAYPSATALRDDSEDRRQLRMDAILDAGLEAAPARPRRAGPFPLFDRFTPVRAPREAGPDPDAAPDADGRTGEALFTLPLPCGKRIFDIAGAALGLLVLSPLLLCIAVLVRVQSRGPVFFVQDRIGRWGRPFRCYKFRTMRVDSDPGVHHRHVRRLMEEDVPLAKLDDGQDPRLIPLGRLLRRSALDELPQLWNVLKGDMSLIGPRPCIPYEYADLSRWQRRRSDAAPGLTGLWQVSGKNRTTFNEMMRLDIRYTRRRTLRLDAAILWRTLPAIIQQMRDGFVGQGRRERVTFLERVRRAGRRGRETLREALRHAPSAATMGRA